MVWIEQAVDRVYTRSPITSLDKEVFSISIMKATSSILQCQNDEINASYWLVGKMSVYSSVLIIPWEPGRRIWNSLVNDYCKNKVLGKCYYGAQGFSKVLDFVLEWHFAFTLVVVKMYSDIAMNASFTMGVDSPVPKSFLGEVLNTGAEIDILEVAQKERSRDARNVDGRTTWRDFQGGRRSVWQGLEQLPQYHQATHGRCNEKFPIWL